MGFLTGLIRGQYQVEITSDKFLKDASVNFGINKAGPNIPIKCKIPYTNMSLVVKPTLSISQDETDFSMPLEFKIGRENSINSKNKKV